jgi:hypothetical protein
MRYWILWFNLCFFFNQLHSQLCCSFLVKRGYEEIRDRKLLEILKKDRTWLKYELHCNVKTSVPLFFQNNLTFVIQMLINVFLRIVFVRTFFLHISRESNNIFLLKIDDCKLNLYVSLIMTVLIRANDLWWV